MFFSKKNILFCNMKEKMDQASAYAGVGVLPGF